MADLNLCYTCGTSIGVDVLCELDGYELSLARSLAPYGSEPNWAHRDAPTLVGMVSSSTIASVLTGSSPNRSSICAWLGW